MMKLPEVEKTVIYWRAQANDSWGDAEYLVAGHRYSLGLFAAHLALEKILKAHVCRRTRDNPPRIHNLIRLAELAGIALDTEQSATLSEMNQFQIEGRYLDLIMPPLKQVETEQYTERAKQVFEWLMNLS